MKKKKENYIFGNDIDTKPSVTVNAKTAEEAEKIIDKVREYESKKAYYDRDGVYVSDSLEKAAAETHMTYQECLKYKIADRDDVMIMSPIKGEMDRFEPKDIYRYVVPWIYPRIPEEHADGSMECLLAKDIVEGEWMMPLSEKRNCKALLPLYDLFQVQGINRDSREWIKEKIAAIYRNASFTRESDIHRHFFIKEDEMLMVHPELEKIKEFAEKR